MKTKITKLLMAFILLASVAFAQEGKKAVIKLNIVKWAMVAPNIQGEYAIHKNISIAVGMTGFRRGLPNSIVNKFGTTDTNKLILSSLKLGLFAITPEIRFYLGKKEEHQAPHGFYLAPYMKYSRYKLTLPFNYIDPKSASTYTFVGKYKNLGFGLMMGSQWVTKSGFTFDWWILGAHKNATTLSAGVEGDFSSYTQADKDKVTDSMNNNFGNLPGSPKFTTTFTNSKVEAVAKFSTWGIRGMGFNIGWAF